MATPAATTIVPPLKQGDLSYVDRRSAKTRLRQQGSLEQLIYNVRPLAGRLRICENMVRQDLTINSAVNTRVESIVGSIGLPAHPDPEIQEYHRNNLLSLEDQTGKSWEQILTEIQFTKDWAGFSVSEVCYNINFGVLTLKDIPTYHPSTILIYPDKDGMLTENNPSLHGHHKSGIYQHCSTTPGGERQLELWKHIYMSNNSEYGNYYGQSLVAPCYKWHRLKEVLLEQSLVVLDRAGKRITWVRSPNNTMSDQDVIDNETGERRALTTLEYISNQLQANDGDISAIILPQTTPGSEFKPEIGSVPLSDNFGNVFLDKLHYVDQEEVRHIIPYFLIRDTSSLEAARERRMEVYFKTIYNQRKILSNHLIQKVMMPSQTWNFNREAARIPPTFTHKYSDRPEDRVATMQVVTGLTEKGYLNPLNSMDWEMVRQMTGLSSREMDADDIEFINKVVIDPLAPTAGNEAVKQVSAGRPKANPAPQQKDRQAAKPTSGSATKKNLKAGG